MVTSINKGIIHLQLCLPLTGSLLATTLPTILPSLPLNIDSINVTGPDHCILFNAHYINNHLTVALVTCPICLTFQELYH